MQPQHEGAPQTPAPQPKAPASTQAGASAPVAATPPAATGVSTQPPRHEATSTSDQVPDHTPAAAPEGAATSTSDQTPAAATVKRPLVPMAAFDRIPTRWVLVAGGVVALLVIALGAVLLFGGRSGRSTTGAPVQAAPATTAAPSGPGPTGPAGTSTPGSSSAPVGASGGGTAPGGANQPAPAGVPPASVDALKALLIPPPGTDSTVDTEPITDTTFEGARWGVTLFWVNPEGSMVLAQYGTPDQARAAISQYRDSVHQSGICDETPVAGRADAFLCAAKGLGDGAAPGDIPAIGLGLKGTVIALVTAANPGNVSQLLVTQLDRLP